MDENTKKAFIQIITPLLAAKYVTLIMWFFVAIIIICGMILSYCLCDWHILSRSGGVVIVCALLLALFDYTTSVKNFFKQVNDYFGTKLKDEQLKGVRNKIKQDLEQHGVIKPENEIDYMALEKIEFHFPAAVERLGNSFKMQSIKSEIAIAIVGTMISSFGDLIGKIPFFQ